MKLFSQVAELSVIKTIASAGDKNSKQGVISKTAVDAASYLLASVDASHFHYAPALAAYERIMLMARKRAIVMRYSDLIEDLSINEEYRDILAEYRKKPVSGIANATALFDTLCKYRKARILYYAAKETLEQLKSTEIDVDKVLDDVANRITEARTQSSDTDLVLTVGKDANDEGLGLVDEALSEEDDILIKTGYSEFDRKNGGLPAEGVMLIAATSSGGKSTLRMNLLSNIYKLNMIDVSTISFEQNAKKETRRHLSFLTGIPFWKFTRKALSAEEKKQCRIAWKKFHRYGEKHGCKYALMCPTRGLTMAQTLMLVRPYGFKVIAIDYISLLDGVEEGKEAMVLKAIVREAKIFSGHNKCLIILLAQLDSDTSNIRYSRGMLEDSDNVWIWNYTAAEDRDRHRLPVKQKKARDGELFDFELEERFDVMQILNPEEEIEAALQAAKQSGNYKPSRQSSKSEGLDPLQTDEVSYAVE